MKQDILNKLFAEELGQSAALINDYYGSFIAEMDSLEDIAHFAEQLTEELRDDYTGELPEDERAKYHHALMLDAMTNAWNRMEMYEDFQRFQDDTEKEW